MPKDRTKRSVGHSSSVKLAKRQFAAPENQKIEHVEVGSSAETPANELLARPEVQESKNLKKQDKQELRREALLQRLELSRSPYSKSHQRRAKRKAREQLGGGLTDMQAALESLHEEKGEPKHLDDTTPHINDTSTTTTPKSKAKPGQIGEGKGATLSKNQRKKVLQAERLRHPLILQNPDFASNPFQTIRTHAQNTLVKHTSS